LSRIVFWQRQALVGLDIQPEEVRLLYMRYAKRTFWLEQAAALRLPTGAVCAGKMVLTEQVSKALRILVQQTGTAGCPAAVALPAGSVMTQHLQLPLELQDKECAAEIAANLQHYFPGSQDELVGDFVRRQQNLFLIAARHEQVMAYAQVVQSAGLEPVIIDMDSYAVARAVQLAVKQSDFAVWVPGQAFIVVNKNEIIFYESLRDEWHEAWQRILQWQRASSTPILSEVFVPDFAADDVAQLQHESGWMIRHFSPFATLQLSKKINVPWWQQAAVRMWVNVGLGLRCGSYASI
jgi:hypothetical protein